MKSGNETHIYPAASKGAQGDITGSADFHYHYPVANKAPVDCVGKLVHRVYHGALWVSWDARGDITINAAPETAAGPSDSNFRPETLRSCHRASPQWPGRREFEIDHQLTFTVTPKTLAIAISRNPHSRMILPPVDLILAHQGFELKTGNKMENHDWPRSSDHAQWRASIVFTPK